MGKGIGIDGLTSIVAIDIKGAIGCRNALPWTLKSDMAFFRKQTLGNSIIMGRKTFDSIGKSLPGRKNIVLSHNDALFAGSDECQLALSVGEALFRVAGARTEQAFVIGGAQTYAQFAPYVSRYLVTVVDHHVPDADAFLGKELLDAITAWERTTIDSFPACAGRDDFPFQIFEITAPDVSQRVERLNEEIERYAGRVQKRATKPRARSDKQQPGQELFAF